MTLLVVALRKNLAVWYHHSQKCLGILGYLTQMVQTNSAATKLGAKLRAKTVHLDCCHLLGTMKPVPIKAAAQETPWFVRLLAVLVLFALGGAFNEWFNPSVPPFKGRAWLIEAIFAFAGTTGLVCLWLLVGAALTASARFIWRRTYKLPSDRWL